MGTCKIIYRMGGLPRICDLLDWSIGIYRLAPSILAELIDSFRRDRAELIGIGIAVLIIDNANEAIKRREKKETFIADGQSR